jgi:nitronate monooxygenase
VQAGTAFLASDQSLVAPVHRTALSSSRDDGTAITNLFTGRPARGLVNRLMRELGPMSDDVPPFPHAAAALAPLRVAAEAQGSGDFQPLWAGQAAALSHSGDAEAIASRMIDEARVLLR